MLYSILVIVYYDYNTIGKYSGRITGYIVGHDLLLMQYSCLRVMLFVYG